MTDQIVLLFKFLFGIVSLSVSVWPWYCMQDLFNVLRMYCVRDNGKEVCMDGCV